jgi:Holliday junction DNA helicase RuvA
MIAGLEGILEQVGTDSVIIRVSGVSFQVHVPASTLNRLGPVGGRVHVHTYLHWKEDSTALYGFTTPQELDLFKMLIGVSGVGPKSALSMLSGLTPDDLALAILNNNVDLITQAPGIGKKTASRVVLELKSKLEKGWVGAVGGQQAEDNADIVTALTNLGYSTSDASHAAAAVPNSGELSLEDKVRIALRHLARQ